MVVIGGFNSSNTISLAALCAERVPTYHIESSAGIDPERGTIHYRPRRRQAQRGAMSTTGCRPGPVRVGITAGASTPNNKIGDVVGARARDARASRARLSARPIVFTALHRARRLRVDRPVSGARRGRDRRRRRARARRPARAASRRSARRRCSTRTLTSAGPSSSGTISSSLSRGSSFRTSPSDGATIGDVFGEQLPQLEESDDPMLVTLTIGGNDLLSAYGNRAAPVAARAHRARHRGSVRLSRRHAATRLPDGHRIVLTTVYDPSDRSGKIPGVFEDAGPLPLDVLDRLNAHVRTLGIGHAADGARRRVRAFPRPRRRPRRRRIDGIGAGR